MPTITSEEMFKRLDRLYDRPWGFLYKYSPKGLGYNWMYYIKGPHKLVSDYWWHVRMAWQRVFHGYDVTATYDYHAFMMRQAIPVLSRIKDHPGIPMSTQLGTIGDDMSYMDRAAARAAWVGVLQEIIIGFEADMDLHDGFPDAEEIVRCTALADRAWELYVEWRHSLWT